MEFKQWLEEVDTTRKNVIDFHDSGVDEMPESFKNYFYHDAGLWKLLDQAKSMGLEVYDLGQLVLFKLGWHTGRFSDPSVAGDWLKKLIISQEISHH